MKKALLYLTLVSFFGFGQKQGNIWYFGDQAGLDFNSGSPVFISGGQNQLFGCAGCHAEAASSICDSSGALLFYSNAAKVWNRNHLLMLNGDSLNSNPSSTQGALFVPRPGSSSRHFYLFTTDAFQYNNLQYGFRYSLIDQCLDNGLGGIVQGQKNIKLLDTVAEKLVAVRHSNGIDYWIVVHKYYSDAFYSYLLTSAGITNTVITHIGSVHPTGLQTNGGAIGQMKISPNGQKIALVNGNSSNNIAEYFDFNPSTGVVSNSVNIQWNLNYNFYGVEFSPDNSKLYISCCLNGNGIYQFDLTAGGGNAVAVNASRTQIAFTYNYLGMQLGPDGRIYCARSPFLGNPFLSVINTPNNAGVNCNYNDNAINLNSRYASYGPPNFITAYSYSNEENICLNVGISENTISTTNYTFPNPNNGTFKLQIDFEITNGQLILLNSLGQKVHEQKIINGVNEINTNGLPLGLYHYILLRGNKAIKNGKLAIE
jgi:hypothetical protein